MKRGGRMRKDTYFTAIQNISLRGSLAQDFLCKSMEHGISRKELENYVFNIAMSKDRSLLKLYDENGVLVIGKKSELGHCYPDW